jgi:lysylphosphatidylglycerol synthetase-like protein (DUF2156 family)
MRSQLELAVGCRARAAALLVIPPLGAVLVALASRREGLYRLLVREDAVLEWAQVLAYVLAVALGVVGGPRLWRRGERAGTAVVVVLAAAAALSAGEEIAWGQRIFGFGTPELFAENQQGETTLHNDPALELPSRVALLLAGLYGVATPIAVRASTPLTPPRALISFFAVVVAYFAFRLLFLHHPTYVEAKYSEWPEFCLAFATAYWCAAVATRNDRGDAEHASTHNAGE